LGILFRPFGLLAAEDLIFWLSNLLTLSLPDESDSTAERDEPVLLFFFKSKAKYYFFYNKYII